MASDLMISDRFRHAAFYRNRELQIYVAIAPAARTDRWLQASERRPIRPGRACRPLADRAGVAACHKGEATLAVRDLVDPKTGGSGLARSGPVAPCEL